MSNKDNSEWGAGTWLVLIFVGIASCQSGKNEVYQEAIDAGVVEKVLEHGHTRYKWKHVNENIP